VVTLKAKNHNSQYAHKSLSGWWGCIQPTTTTDKL
jgi:hypothetical protein